MLLKIFFISLLTQVLATSQHENLNALVKEADALIKNGWFIKLKNLVDIFPFVKKYEGNEEATKILHKFDEKLNGLEDYIIAVEDGCKLVTKLNHLGPYFAQITTAEDSLLDYVENYYNNATLLVEKLDDLNHKLMTEKYERTIVNYIDESSIAKHLGDYVRVQNHPTVCKLHSSVAKEVFEFYFAIFVKILRIFSVQQIAMEIKQNLTKTSMEDDFKFLAHSKTHDLEKWMESMEAAIKSLTQDDDHILCIQIKRHKQTVRFRNVLQVFFEGEIDQQCKPNAHPELLEKYDRQGCYGRIRNCTFLNKISVLESHWKHPEIPDHDRIYEGFAYGFIWYGRGSLFDSRVRYFDSHDEVCQKGGNVFEVTLKRERCICDQIDHPKTLRKLYIGRIEAPTDHVITGIRFAKTPKRDAIFLQIQVAKLHPMMLVAEDTVHWLDFLNHTQSNDYITYDFDHRPKLYLTGGLRFDDGVLTGLQLFNFKDGVTLKVFGRKIEDFSLSKLGNGMYGLTGPMSGSVVNKHGVGLHNDIFHKNKYIFLSEGAIDFNYSTEETDAGQTFVPFFDGDDVTFTHPAPISGMGLIHYTNDPNYAGYIWPIIETMDYGKIFA